MNVARLGVCVGRFLRLRAGAELQVGQADDAAQLVDRVVQASDGGAHFVRGGGAGLGGGCVGLRDFVDLRHGAADVADAVGLFAGRLGETADQLIDATHASGDVEQLGGDLAADLAAALGGTDGVADASGGFARGVGRAFGERADFLGDHGEAGAGLTRAGGLDGGVEREDVRLEGDFVDALDDLLDAATGLGEFLHGGLQSGHAGLAVGAQRARFGRLAGGLAHAGVRRFADGK